MCEVSGEGELSGAKRPADDLITNTCLFINFILDIILSLTCINISWLVIHSVLLSYDMHHISSS